MLNFNLNANSFYAYMRQMQSQHKEIGKDKADESRKHFFIGELEDFYKGLKSLVLFPALVVEGFQISLSDDEQQTKYRESAFCVVFDYEQHSDYEQQIDCFSKSEDIGLEILRRMAEDASESVCPINITEVSGVPILNETDRYAGVRFSFSLSNANVTEIDDNQWIIDN